MSGLSPFHLWLILGIVLVIAEMVTTTFVLLFFGVAALITALATFLGVHSLVIQLVLFAVLGVAGVILFREKIKSAIHVKESHSFDGLQNTRLELAADIPSHGSVSLMHQGTTWTAVNGTDAEMKKGEKVVISRVDGVKLILGK